MRDWGRRRRDEAWAYGGDNKEGTAVQEQRHLGFWDRLSASIAAGKVELQRRWINDGAELDGHGGLMVGRRCIERSSSCR